MACHQVSPSPIDSFSRLKINESVDGASTLSIPNLLKRFSELSEDRCDAHNHLANHVCVPCMVFLCRECLEEEKERQQDSEGRHCDHQVVSADGTDGQRVCAKILKLRGGELSLAEKKVAIQRRRLLMAGRGLMQQSNICKTVAEDFYQTTSMPAAEARMGRKSLLDQIEKCTMGKMRQLEAALTLQKEQTSLLSDLQSALNFLQSLNSSRQKIRGLVLTRGFPAISVTMEIPQITFHILTSSMKGVATLVDEGLDSEKYEAYDKLSALERHILPLKKSVTTKHKVSACLTSTSALPFEPTDLEVGRSGRLYMTDGEGGRIVMLKREREKFTEDRSWKVGDNLDTLSLALNEELSVTVLCAKKMSAPKAGDSCMKLFSIVTIDLSHGDSNISSSDSNPILSRVAVSPSSMELTRIRRAPHSGLLLATSLRSGCIYKLASDGEAVGLITSGLVMPSQMAVLPRPDISPSSSPALFVSSSPSSSPVTTRDTSSDESDRVLVADLVSGVLNVSAEGNFVGSVVPVGVASRSALRTADCPWTVAVSPQGDWVAVGDMGQSRVNAYTLGGFYLGEICSGVDVSSMAVCDDGSLIAIDACHRVVHKYLVVRREMGHK